MGLVMKKASLLLMLLLVATPAISKPFKEADLIGAWGYVSGYTITPDGERLDQFGEHPQGIFIILPSHLYSHIVMKPDLPKVKSGLLKETAPGEQETLAEGVLAHYGTWQVDEDRGTLTVHIEKSSFPNFDGIQQTRLVTILDKDTLEYVNTTSSTGPGAKVVSRLRRLP